MQNRLIMLAVMLGAVLAINCVYSTQAPCQEAGCTWTAGVNATCSLPSTPPTCLSSQAYYNAWQECVTCSSLASGNCTSVCASYYWTGSTCTSCTTLDSNCVTCNSGSVCQNCATGFIVDSSNTQYCIDSTCSISNCINCNSASTCADCRAGFKVINSGASCGDASCTVTNCANCDGTVCGVCEGGYQISADSSACTLICNDANC